MSRISCLTSPSLFIKVYVCVPRIGSWWDELYYWHGCSLADWGKKSPEISHQLRQIRRELRAAKSRLSTSLEEPWSMRTRCLAQTVVLNSGFSPRMKRWTLTRIGSRMSLMPYRWIVISRSFWSKGFCGSRKPELIRYAQFHRWWWSIIITLNNVILPRSRECASIWRRRNWREGNYNRALMVFIQSAVILSWLVNKSVTEKARMPCCRN